MDIQKQRKWPFLSISQNTEYGKIVQNGGIPIANRQGCSSRILNLTPKGDRLGAAQTLCDP